MWRGQYRPRDFPGALVESERRVLVTHQRGVGEDPVNPAVDPEYQVEQRAQVPAGEEQGHHGNQDKEPQQGEPCSTFVGGPQVIRIRLPGPGGTGERGNDEQMRDCKQPPFDQDQSAREPFGVVHFEVGRIVRAGRG
jgi:hypothetical protein